MPESHRAYGLADCRGESIASDISTLLPRSNISDTSQASHESSCSIRSGCRSSQLSERRRASITSSHRPPPGCPGGLRPKLFGDMTNVSAERPTLLAKSTNVFVDITNVSAEGRTLVAKSAKKLDYTPCLGARSSFLRSGTDCSVPLPTSPSVGEVPLSGPALFVLFDDVVSAIQHALSFKGLSAGWLSALAVRIKKLRVGQSVALHHIFKEHGWNGAQFSGTQNFQRLLDDVHHEKQRLQLAPLEAVHARFSSQSCSRT